MGDRRASTGSRSGNARPVPVCPPIGGGVWVGGVCGGMPSTPRSGTVRHSQYHYLPPCTTITPCALVWVGVGGCMPVHGGMSGMPMHVVVWVGRWCYAHVCRGMPLYVGVWMGVPMYRWVWVGVGCMPPRSPRSWMSGSPLLPRFLPFGRAPATVRSAVDASKVKVIRQGIPGRWVVQSA